MLPDFSGKQVQCGSVVGSEFALYQAGGPSLRDCIEHSVDGLLTSGGGEPKLALATVRNNPNQMNPLHMPINTKRSLGFKATRNVPCEEYPSVGILGQHAFWHTNVIRRLKLSGLLRNPLLGR